MSQDEQVHVDPKTGARKAFNLQMIGLIPAKFILALAKHYGVGSRKYAKHNWRKGYDWELSYNSAMRHLLAFWDGEDDDVCHCATPAESFPCEGCGATGSPHVIAAAWHCAALHTFMEEHPELDSRWSTTSKENHDDLTESGDHPQVD